ncbi:Toprim-like [Ekhidna lutea]|uniref:Toprim-like n=2 Tax=Ekhidna lutea TaxID=447679 RepID=A0A239LET2_EKHLU|nr:Toprim-like [Ekhidna lutea]
MDPEILLRELGHEPVRRNGNELLYRAPYRDDSHPSLSLNRKKRVWIDYGTGEGGKMVDLVMRIMGEKSVLSMLQRIRTYGIIPSIGSNPKPVDLIKKSYEILSVTKVGSEPLIRYLKKRGINLGTVYELINEVRYKNTNGVYYALAFENRSSGFEIRNELMKKAICLGNKDISIVNGEGQDIAVFEGFFDFLSYLELYPNRPYKTHLILNSIAMTDRAISYLKGTGLSHNIELYLDNDSAGRMGSEKFMKACGNRVIDKSDSYNLSKDLNDHLTRLIKRNNQHGKGFGL